MSHNKYMLANREVTLRRAGYAATYRIARAAQEIARKRISELKQMGSQDYVVRLDGYISDIDKADVSSIANDKAIRDHADMWLEGKAVLRSYVIYANWDNKEVAGVEEGSKLWHTDDGVITAAEYYVNLSNVEEDSGPLYVIRSKKSNRLLAPSYPAKLQGKDIWRRYRYFDEDMKRFFGESLTQDLVDNIGDIGKVTFIDSGLFFHKGGNTISGSRIVLRLVYSRWGQEELGCISSSTGSSFVDAKELHRSDKRMEGFEKFLLKVRTVL